MNPEDWQSLWKKLGASGDASPVFRFLVSKYGESTRAYHKEPHIDQCLGELETCRHLLQQPDDVEAAIYFHDIFYDVKRKDNEEASALYAEDVLRKAKVNKNKIEHICFMILNSKEHKSSDDVDTQFFNDIDFSIVGQDWHAFREYEGDIFKEYVLFGGIVRELYYPGRIDFLNGLLKKDRIFLTDLFSNKYEDQAKKNIVKIYAEKHT